MLSRTTRGAVTLAVLGAVALAGCSADPQATTVSGLQARVPSPTPPSAAASVAPPPSAAPSVLPSVSAAPAVASPAAPRPASYDVVAVKSSLRSLGYYAGPMSTERGSTLRSAVMAFQKVQGIGADGAVGPATLAALKSPRKPSLRFSSPASRVEVDLTRQVLYVVKGGQVARILPVSSGNGATYSQKDGSKAKALTPVGSYRVQRRIIGERNADLGTLYDPQYFYRGWAIHGSNSVPARPASHGCVRVTRADAKYLLKAIGVGTTVQLYGGTHTFTAGSGAAGTDAPTGDTAADAPPSPKPASSPTARPAAKPSPAKPRPAPSSAAPKPSKQPSPAPSPSRSSAAAKPSPTP